ncbi:MULTISPECIES: hypothetical protein [unclassified Streptomyces]|uniref:hypothetical protein n=1 Tax=unclassified Streptomyces TaxID=2593676 RepID=UPI00225BBAB6|nr:MULTISPECIES: hypothetical protein [unclassified Streptomyces]MCX4525305.1 hypothetical protein [Streptomyces sp. NBC_01551]MCX4544220.1 hypothetical protein [Streptomyces sp. NBC_01565]
MRADGTSVRGRRRLRRRQACAAALALCGALALTACNGDGDGTGNGGGAGAAGASPGGSPATPAASAAPSAPAAAATPSGSATATKKPAPTATPTAATPGKPKPPAPGPTCDHKMPISPDEIAVYRYTPEGGFHSLIVKHGNWGCAVAGGATPFETVGVETFLPIAEDAKITAVTPIVASPVSKPITLHELTSWLESHPNKGLVFRYHLDGKGVITTLDQEEYTL